MNSVLGTKGGVRQYLIEAGERAWAGQMPDYCSALRMAFSVDQSLAYADPSSTSLDFDCPLTIRLIVFADKPFLQF